MSDKPVLSFKFRLQLAEYKLALAHDMALAGVTALFGHSGSGKTTVLRVLAGLEEEADAYVSYDGEPWQTPAPDKVFVPPHSRAVGYVFQEARLFPHLDVKGNLDFAAKRGADRTTGTDFETVVGRLDLEPLLERRTEALSGGERQRVALARALLTKPRLMLMDEPMSALDPRRKSEILPYIAKLPEDFQVPVIYVTHSVDEVAYLADTMIVLSKGRKVADGPVADTLARLDLGPATGRFEAGVVLDTKVAAHDPEYRLTTLDISGQTVQVPLIDAELGAAIRLRVRARDVILSTQRPDAMSSRNIFQGHIIEIIEEAETPFAETLVEIPGGRLRARITRKSAADLKLKTGAEVFAIVKSISLAGATTLAR